MTSSSPSTAPSGLTSELVTAIDHVGIAVPDLDAAIAWYGKHLGMVSLHEEVNEEQGVREAMLGYPGQVAGATAIQLLAPLNENSTIAKFIDRSGPGLQQLAFRVTRPTSTRSAPSSRRRRCLRRAGGAPRRSRINFIHPKDGGGVLIELVEPAADGGH
ncbi:methylmalonyl-CoA epimerase [Rhodococcus hoagii]|nr:methylmalonyl-CoA epimerase [Prescottella equi]